MLQNYGNQRPVLEEPAMEGTSDSDPFSLNNSCGRKRRTVICGTCGGNHYRVGIEICDYLLKMLVVYLAIFVLYLAKPFFPSFKIFVRVFSNFRRLFSKTLEQHKS